MKPAPQSEEALFQVAAQQAGVERTAFLNGACHGNPALRQRLETLLAAHDAEDSFLEPEHPGPGCEPLKTMKLDLPDPPDEAVGQTLGRYKLLERVGEGGCGVVYVAEQKEPVRRRVALKVIKLGMDTKAVVARFEAERQALAMMDHPNIAKVLDAGTTDVGRPYFVMELVRGIRITDYCDQANLSTKERLDLFIKVCQAIQHAHQKGIIHRDIKPSNILVTLHDGVPVPKVIDFGIAKATEGRLTDATIYTQLHQFIGTPAYMSPEQAEMSGLDIDTRSDIYSLGVLLYELLAGSTPFNGQELMSMSLEAMRKTIREKEPARPSIRLATLLGDELTTTAKRRAVEAPKLIHLLKGDLDWIVMKCLEKDRARRYDTANGLAMDIKRHLNNEPVLARPPSKLYEFQKTVRRHKFGFAAMAAIIIVLAAGVTLTAWQAARATNAKREALSARQQAEAKAHEAIEAREEASQQRNLAAERLYESLIREAGSVRKARQIGYRREVFDLLKQALALGTTNVDDSLVRREAAACLGDWVGIDPVDISDPQGNEACALTTDGTLAAIATGDNNVSLRETRTGREVASLEMQGGPYNLVFDQSGRALFIALAEPKFVYGERPKSVRVEKWGLRADGSWKRDWARTAAGFTRFVPTAGEPVALVVGESDSFLAVMDKDMQVELARVPVHNRMDRFPWAAISPDRLQLAFFSRDGAGGIDDQLEVWDLVSKLPVVTLHPHLGLGAGLSFAPDGRFLAASYEITLSVYETRQFSSTFSMGGGFEQSFGGTIGGSAGLLAMPVPQELAVRLIQVRSGREMAYLKLPDLPFSQCFSRDGSVLLVTHRRGSRIFHLNVNRERLIQEGHQGGVSAVEFSPNGKQLASLGKDRTLRLWDLAAPGQSRILGHLPAPGQTLAYTPDGEFLVCGYYNIGELSIWSLATGKQVCTVNESADHAGTTWTCAISPDGQCLAAIGTGLRIWNLANLTQPVVESGFSDAPLISESNGSGGVVFDPVGKHVAYKGLKSPGVSAILMRGLDPGDRPSVVAANSVNNAVQELCFLPKSGEIAYMTTNREVALVNSSTGQVIRQYPTLKPGETPAWFVSNLRASPDGSKLAMVTPSGLGVDLRDPDTGKLLYTLPDEPDSIWWLAWSPDSQRLAVSRANGDIAIWNLKEVEGQLSQL